MFKAREEDLTKRESKHHILIVLRIQHLNTLQVLLLLIIPQKAILYNQEALSYLSPGIIILIT